MEETYFLGANSRAGFASLYRHFAAAPGDTLHVIKGGPGTGKSGFMRRIAAAARERGLAVETVLCSGDPDSLDGVYIPALQVGWVDGTAPHVLDPAHFGADGDYLDLGRFCRLPLSGADRARVLDLTGAYKARYAAAYRYLAAAGALGELLRAEPAPEAEQKLRRRFRGLIQRSAPRMTGGRETARFLTAISCRSRIALPLPGWVRVVYRIDDGRGLAAAALRIAAEEAAARGLDRILCPSPLDPAVPEALLLPQAGLALLAGGTRRAGEHGLRPAAPPAGEERQSRRRAERLQGETVAAAIDELGRAKALHDELEAVYRPYMDFPALTAFTEESIDRIFA